MGHRNAKEAIPLPRLTAGIPVARVRNMVMDLLTFRGIPERLSMAFLAATTVEDYNRLAESPLFMDSSIQTWATLHNQTLEYDELVQGVALVLNRVDPGVSKDMHSYAAAFIAKYPAVTSGEGIIFWSLTSQHYQRLSAAGKEELVIHTRIMERDNMRRNRQMMVQQIRLLLLSNQLFNGENGEAKIHEFIGKNRGRLYSGTFSRNPRPDGIPILDMCRRLCNHHHLQQQPHMCRLWTSMLSR